MENNSDGRTRRQAIGFGVAATASAVAIGATAGSGGAVATDWGAVGRVRSVADGIAELDLLAGSAGRAAREVVGRASVPLTGFPDTLLPRAGDRVAVSRTEPGYEAVALPLGHWITGVPAAVGDGTFVINGERVADAVGLRAAAEAGSPITVCLLDTELQVAQPLNVRAADLS